MNFLKLDRPCVLAFLSIAIATVESSSGVPTHRHDDPPFWQFVLREFVFKTISGPPPNDEAVYKKLLEAPFYGGPWPEAVDGERSLVSRGDVYRVSDGRWILCQEGCVNCDPCERRRDPIVKWILRRVMRTRSRSKSPKWDLRLTVFPRSPTGKGPSYDGAYARSRDELGRETTIRDSGPGTTSEFARSQYGLGRETILHDSAARTTSDFARSQDELGRETIVHDSAPGTTFGLARSQDELGRETTIRDSGPGTTSEFARSQYGLGRETILHDSAPGTTSDFARSQDELGRETIVHDSAPGTTIGLARSQDELGRETTIRDSGPGTTSEFARSQYGLGRETILHDSAPRTTSDFARSQYELGRETIVRGSGPRTTSDLARSDWSTEETHSSGEFNIGGPEHSEDSPVPRRRSTGRTRVKRYRVKPSGRPGYLRFYRPQEDVTGSNGPAERSDESTPRLIMGIDQHGEKHLVHVVPVDPPANDPDPMNYRSSYETDNTARIGRTAQQERDGLSYEKLIDRIMSSLNSHRGFIEKFIFSDRLEPEYRKEVVHPSYAFSDPQRARDDDRSDERNFDDYHVEASPGVNQYPTDSGYQMHERDDRFKGRDADAEKEVNKPAGEYQDQTIGYEPYVTSADVRQDERSLASTDGERRRRNLATKVVPLTDDPQGLGQNRTEIYTPDPKFSMNRQLPGNSTDRELTDSRSGINEAGAGMDNLLEERSNEKTSTAEESGRIPAGAG